MNGGAVEILVVEDNPADAELIARVLNKHGLAERSMLLKDGVEALDFLLGRGSLGGAPTDGTPKVILLDLKLPKVDGMEVIRRLKSEERTRTIPVVVLTSSTEQRDIQAAYALGINSYVTKPIEFSKFDSVVSELGKYWLEVNRVPRP